MRSSLLLLMLGLGGALFASERPLTPTMPKDERRLVSFKDVKIDDPFWSPKLKVYCEKTIPHSWQYVRKEIEDNEIAAGWRNEKRGNDTPWNQANLHKVLETCAYALTVQPNPELEQRLDKIISAIAAAQQPNGYCNALITVRKMTPWANLDGQHEGYVAGHLIEAAVAHCEATGKTNLLNVACRVADHIYQYFITEKHEGVCGHAELELALARLYRVTGNKRYLELSQNWIERRGKPWAYTSPTERSYFMDHLPISQVDEITGHAVRSAFYVTGVADTGLETGNLELQKAARRLWQDVTQRKMYVTGAIGSQEKDEGFGAAYDLPNQPGYNESCAGCGAVYFADAMFRLDGKSEAADVLERALYNTVLHGISLEGTNTYYRNPLTDEDRLRNNVWVCCPPCLSRTLLRLPNYLYAQTDRDIYVNLYVGSTADITLKTAKIKLSQQGDYVRNGQMRLQIDPVKKARFALRLRIPGWSEHSAIKLNDKAITKPKLDAGYAVLDRQWQRGDTVEIEFPQTVQRIQADPRIKADLGMVALQRGPIVYGVEGVDNGGQVDVKLPASTVFTTEYRPDFLGGTTVILGNRADGGTFTAIPFFAMANRGKSKQMVWLPQDGLQNEDLNSTGPLYRRVPASGAK